MLIILSLLIGFISSAQAQDAPPEIQVALDDLSQRVGTTVTFNDLDRWEWQGENFNDASLGCPQSGQTYAQVLTPGYIFTLVYQGITYDYRVLQGGSLVILCESGQALPTPTPASVPTPMPPPEITCSAALPVRLNVGVQARTTPGLASNVRAEPDLNAVEVGEIAPGATFRIIGGPSCGSEGLLWWQVQQDTLTGWIAQGENGLYHIEIVPNPLPPAGELSVIDANSVNRGVELSRVQGNVEGVSAWSPDGTTLAAASSNAAQPGVWLYDVNALATSSPRLFVTPSMISAITFSADGNVLITGNVDGMVEFWDITGGQSLFRVRALDTPVRSLNMNPAGTLLVIIGDPPTMILWGVP